MKVFTSVIAAAILGFAQQAIAEEELSCYDNGWDIDISDGSINDYIYDFCGSRNESSNGVPTPYAFSRSDGSPFIVDFTVTGDMDSETCQEGLTRVIQDCPGEVSDGDTTLFKGGAVIDQEAFTGASIDCQNDFCPKF